MGFFGALGKVLAGKPVFEPTAQGGGHGQHSGHGTPTESGDPNEHKYDAQGRKIIPLVIVERIECHVNGHHMEIQGEIKNESHMPMYLDKIRLLGMTRELDTLLQPEQSREFLLYQGSLAQGTNDSNAELQFKDETGDYFSTPHAIEFQQEHEGYSVRNLRAQHVRDIQ